ncbi:MULTISPECIES: hypothetical protein [Curtobacterium]|uniref:hypothetical protein n=1 Tax=Curtobacterium flaccumfaciens TaxID=2035 RepID=UPI003EE75A0D
MSDRELALHAAADRMQALLDGSLPAHGAQAVTIEVGGTAVDRVAALDETGSVSG